MNLWVNKTCRDYFLAIDIHHKLSYVLSQLFTEPDITSPVLKAPGAIALNRAPGDQFTAVPDPIKIKMDGGLPLMTEILHLLLSCLSVGRREHVTYDEKQ